jgi:paraquat-inducible protein B
MRTDEGKNISSQNAIKHGGCSEKHLIMRDERMEDFNALENVWMSSYDPRDAAEHHMVEQITRADWFYQRAERNFAEVEVGLMELASPADWTEEQEKKLARMQRYLTARANLLTKAKKALEDYRKNRTNETVKAEKHEIVKQTAKRKEVDDMTVEECLKEMEEIAALRRQGVR